MWRCEAVDNCALHPRANFPAIAGVVLLRGKEEATVILTLLVAAGAVLLAVIGRALIAPRDDLTP